MCRRIFNALAFGVAAALLACSAGLARAQDLDQPMFVVALASQDGGDYRRAVMLATPVRGGQIGLILNRPLPFTMGDVFPELRGKPGAAARMFYGGGDNMNQVFALTRAETRPSPKSLALMPGVWLMTEASAIDKLLATAPDSARYFVGFVYWEPGELAAEIKKGWMAVRPADPAKLFLDDTSRLYDQVVPFGRGVGPTSSLEACPC